MRKTMITLVAITSVSVGLSIPFFSSMNDDDALEYGDVEQINVKLEYDKDENIQHEISDILKERYHETSLSFTRLDSQADDILLNDLYDKYSVETIDENEVNHANRQLADDKYVVNVYMEDTHPPVIEGNSVTLSTSDTFDIQKLNLNAYDVVDGKLNPEIVSNNVNSSVPGNYSVTVEATDRNGLVTQKTFGVNVAKPDPGVVKGPTNTKQVSNTPRSYTSMPALDRNNLNVRGWVIVANDPRVSDSTLRSYMNELRNLPAQYSTSDFSTVYIDLSLPSNYLGMAYSSGKLVINGSQYYASTILHEATHAYDFRRGFANDPALISARNAEVNNLPVRYSGNMRSDMYEWVANIVVFYYYDPVTLQRYAPQSYNYVVNVILR